MSEQPSYSQWPEHLQGIPECHEDRRNVIDYYKYWQTDAIRADLDTRRHPFAVMVENLAIDFNVGTVIRNANAFLAQRVWIAGHGKWDRRGAMGVQNYEHVSKSQDSMEVIEQYRQDGYSIIAIDNQPGSKDMTHFQWPEKSLMVFGQEQIGVSPWALQAADHLVYIPQWGSVRSLNVGVASGLAMFSWASQWARHPGGFAPEQVSHETA